jgi:hypothetical protein
MGENNRWIKLLLLAQILRQLEEKYKTSFGFKHTFIRSLRKVKLDGGADSTVVFGMKAMRDGLSSRTYFHEPGPGTSLAQLKWTFKVIRTPPDHSVEFHVRDKSHSRFLGDAEFIPPLHKDDEVNFEISEESADTYLVTKEKILDKIRNGIWLLSEPYEWTKFLILYPTDELTIEVIFPDEYLIEGEQLFDVTVGESTYRNCEEVDRLKKENAFSHEKLPGEHGEKHVLRLSVNDPIMGMCYWVRWIPLLTEDYQKLLTKRT